MFLINMYSTFYCRDVGPGNDGTKTKKNNVRQSIAGHVNLVEKK